MRIITFTLLMTCWGGGGKNLRKKKTEQYSELAKASTSILKLSKRGGKRLGWGVDGEEVGGGWVKISPGHFGCQTTLWFKLWVN